jgi:hypothetical protein
MQLGGRSANYHKLVFEVRYDQGFTYLDRCGATANRILATDPAWVIRGNNVNPQGAPLIHAVTGTQLTFNMYKYDFSLDQPLGREAALTNADITAFVSQVTSISSILHEELSLTRFQRKGFRVWFVFPAESDEDSNDWIKRLGGVTVAPMVSERLDGELESQSHVLVIRRLDRKLRISVNPVERLETLDLGTDALRTLPRNLPRAQREAVLEQARARRRILASPEFAVMIDVDAFVDEPIEVDPGPFISESLQLMESRLPLVFGGTK